MRRLLPLLLLIAAAWAFVSWRNAHSPTLITVGTPSPTTAAPRADGLPAFLPPEARHTLDTIRRGGPFPYRQDGTVFGNRERLLPDRPRGYYHEYTVPTPGMGTRGARRIVTGGNPPETYYYTNDHYRSFRSFQVHP